MYSEDDTFRHLTRCPYQEAWNKIAETVKLGVCIDVHQPYDSKITDALAKVGWTEVELKEKYRDYLLSEDPSVVNYSWWPQFITLIEKLQNE